MKELLGHGVLPIPPQGINGREGVEPATSVHKRKEKKTCKTRGPSRMRTACPLTIRKCCTGSCVKGLLHCSFCFI